ncbi:hypothetical protein ACB094_01G349800 [Castanea mollissima]
MGQYQSDLQPFYQLCKVNEVKLEVQFAAGFRPCQLAVEEAQKSNARWVVLDSHFKKFKEDIRGHINCNLAVVKGKDIAAIMTSTAVQNEIWKPFLRKRNHLHSCQILKVHGRGWHESLSWFLQDIPVLVKCFLKTDERFWSTLKIL